MGFGLRKEVGWSVLLCLLSSCFLLDIFLGSVSIPFDEAVEALIYKDTSNPIWRNILFKIRVPKALTALAAGSALAVCGLKMQTLFRNPLAGPSVLGITAGASLGVAFLVLSGSTATAIFATNQLGVAGGWAVVLASSIGAGLVLLIIVAISFKVKNNVVLLIIGLMVGNMTIAIVSIWQYFSNPELIKEFLMWSFGSLGGVTEDQLWVLLSVVAIGCLAAFFMTKPLNMLLLGEQYAQSMGLNIKKARISIIAITSILAGTVTGFCGPIGFVGIAVPHLAKALFKTANHKLLLPATVLLGAVVLLACDIIAQLPTSASVLPINAVTALMGSPVVIWVIVRNQRQGKLRVMREQNLMFDYKVDEKRADAHVLKTNNLAIGYTNKLLADQINIEIRTGQLVALVGPNGAGKSTLLRTLGQLQPAIQGSMQINEQSINELSAQQLAKILSLVLTNRDFYGNLDVYNLVAMGRYPHIDWMGNIRPDDDIEVKKALEQVGMLSFANHLIHQLSDGERQKVMLARALAQDTPFVFLDEPTAHLDLPNRIELFELLKKLARTSNKAILLTTHELDWAVTLADHMWVLEKNGAFHQGNPQDLIDKQVLQSAFHVEDKWLTRTRETF